jgi:hypothetical protein
VKTTLSETRFDRYLVEHGYDPGGPEPDLGVEKRPDRLIERDGVRVVCEVKEFTTSALAKAGRGPRSFSSKEWYKPVRKTVESAAGQLRPPRDRGLPLVVVISNPKGVPVPLETKDVIYALYGDPTYTLTIDTATGGPVGGVGFGAGRNGRLTNYHPYIRRRRNPARALARAGYCRGALGAPACRPRRRQDVRGGGRAGYRIR